MHLNLNSYMWLAATESNRAALGMCPGKQSFANKPEELPWSAEVQCGCQEMNQASEGSCARA